MTMAMQMTTKVLLVIYTLLTGSHCLQWSAGLDDGATVYVCEGQDATLPWNITLDTVEHLVEITWIFHGHSDQMMATFSHNMFFLAPSYSQRVQHAVPNAGILLSHVTQGDAGRYTVEVILENRVGTHITQRHSVLLRVATVASAAIDATLHVTQEPSVVYNNQTGQHHVQLTCRSLGHQPPAVLWTSPSQHATLSSTRDGDAFSLLLPNPVSGGNYTCRIPPDSPAATCLPRNDPALEGDTVFVDKIEARFSLLEAGQTALQKENDQLKAENTDLRQHVHSLEDTNSKRVIFHARLATDSRLFPGDHIIPTVVYVNQGNAYNPTTGVFTVPFNGAYYFTATAGSQNYSTETRFYTNMYLTVDGAAVSYVWSRSAYYTVQATCSYAGHLVVGQRVWLMVMAGYEGLYYFDDTSTMFSGFLVTAD